VDGGKIASGSIYFFITGIERTKRTNTKTAVHSWPGDNETATDFPIGPHYQLPYINYYIAVGFRQQEAENFYYFTINASPVDSIHWMTEDEIRLYQLVTQ
jgi:hypothetical protein